MRRASEIIRRAIILRPLSSRGILLMGNNEFDELDWSGRNPLLPISSGLATGGVASSLLLNEVGIRDDACRSAASAASAAGSIGVEDFFGA